MRTIILCTLMMMFLAACGTTAEKIENAANRSMTSWAKGRPYTQVAALGNRPMDRLAVDQTGYGQMIGASPLADGTMLYRHIAPGAEMQTSSSFGGLVGSDKTVTNYRLSYFKVGQDGIVQDWATGAVPGTISDCIRYLGGLFSRCEDQGLVSQTLAAYDSVVLTSGGQPMSVWGPVAPPPMPQ